MSTKSRSSSRADAAPASTSPSAAAASSPSSSAAAASSSSSSSHLDEVRLLIDWHHVGGIIGKGGASVKSIREDSGCAINIIAPPPNAPNPQQIDRIMTVKGSVDQASRAIYLIALNMQQRAAERKAMGGEAASAERGRNKDLADGSVAVKLLVHRAAVGAIIGKGGESIKTTQSDTGARIQVSAEPLPHSTDKSVTISGTPEVVQSAVHRVLSQLAESPLRSGTKTVHFVPGPHYYGEYHDASQGAPAGAAASAQGAGPISIQKIAIPTICAGCVIGRGGSIIRSLREQSGTNISIADPDPATPDERVVTITGVAAGIQTAVYLIRQCVESYQPPAQGMEEENAEQQQQ